MSTLKTIAGVVVLAASTTLANATTVSVSGTDVTFEYDDALSQFFGPATVVGDTIVFQPSKSTTTPFNLNIGANASADTFGSPLLGIKAISSSQTFASLNVTEEGRWKTAGTSTDNVGAVLSYSVAGDADPASSHSANGSLSPLTSFGSTTIGSWNASASNDLNSKEIYLTLDNLLYAFTSVSDTSAQILSDKVIVQLQLAAVPIPAAVWLLGAALTALMTFARREERV